jgi:CheY-like chemotaxis protein
MAKKVLVIEDDAFLSSLVCEKLAQTGFVVDTTMSGKEGIEKAHQGVDLVLLDVMLPDMGGFEILETLKKDPATKDIPVIILSNLGGREEIEKGISLGAATYLIKSNVLPHEVAEMVAERLAVKEKEVAPPLATPQAS